MADDQVTPVKQVPQVTPVSGIGGGFSDLANFQAMYANKGKFTDQLDDIVKAMQSVSGSPEKEPVSMESGGGIPEIIKEIPVSVEIEKKPELSGYIENVEKAAENIHPVIDDYKNQVLLSSVNPHSVKIKLPLEEDKIEEGLHHKAWEAIRWLAEWCLRQLKMLKARQIPESASI